MRLSELMKMRVEVEGGAHLGRVKDARLEQRDGGWEVTHLVVGRAAIAERLGFIHGVVERPVVLARVMRRLGRHARVVPWDQLKMRNDLVQVSPGEEQLARPEGYA